VIGEGDATWNAPLAGTFRILVGSDFSIDTQRVYGNDFVEAYGGLSVRLSRKVELRVTGFPVHI
jgi:hypothetical protein